MSRQPRGHVEKYARGLSHVAFLVQQLGPEWKLLLEADEGAVHQFHITVKSRLV